MIPRDYNGYLNKNLYIKNRTEILVKLITPRVTLEIELVICHD